MDLLVCLFFHNNTHAGCFEDYLDTFLFQILLIRQEKNVKSVPVACHRQPDVASCASPNCAELKGQMTAIEANLFSARGGVEAIEV